MPGSPVLILVHGVPGTGKTTLSKRLSKDLELPCLNKDDIKELLFDNMGVGDVAWSQDLGAGVAEMLFAFVDRWINRGRSLIAESAYYYEFAAPWFAEFVKKSNVAVLEVYCKADPDVRRRRFVERNESGQRHPGHIDHKRNCNPETDEQLMVKYAPLRISDIIEVNTTSFDRVDYPKIVSQIRAFIIKSQKEGKQ